MTFSTISRRKLLGTSGAGALALSASSTATMARYAMPGAPCGHGHNHARYAKTLKNFISDVTISEEQKNIALRTAACPECDTHLAPGA